MTATETMTLRAAAIALGVHVNTIRNWILAGDLASIELPSGTRRPVASAVLDHVQAAALAELDSSDTAAALRLTADRLEAHAARLREAADLVAVRRSPSRARESARVRTRE